MRKNITLNEARDRAFLAKQYYESFPNSSKKTVTNPATNSSFEVIDQKRDNNGFCCYASKKYR